MTKDVRNLLCAAVVGAACYGVHDRLLSAKPPATAPAIASAGIILSQIDLDGLPIFPGIPTVDPRPICDAASNPLPWRI